MNPRIFLPLFEDEHLQEEDVEDVVVHVAVMVDNLRVKGRQVAHDVPDDGEEAFIYRLHQSAGRVHKSNSNGSQFLLKTELEYSQNLSFPFGSSTINLSNALLKAHNNFYAESFIVLFSILG